MATQLLYADVILPLPLVEVFTYLVPDEWAAQVEPGMRVVVQFGRHKVYAAIVCRLHHVAPERYAVKPVLEILDSAPVVIGQQFRLWNWVADYYLCSLGEIMAAALPSGLRLQSESVIVPHPDFDGDTSVLSDREFLIYEAMHAKPELSLKDVANILSLRQILPIVRSLVEKRVVLVQEALDERYKPRMVEMIRLNTDKYPEEELGKLMDSLEKKAVRQLDLLMAYLHFSREEGTTEWPKASLLQKSGSNAAALQALIKKEVFIAYRQQADRIPVYKGELIEPVKLNPYQEQALLETRAAVDQGKVVLLHGVTSSGKTELYIHLIAEALEQGRQALYLLPEIALTTQLITRLQKHFGDRLLVYHSRFNENERVEIWNKLLSDHSSGHRPYVVVGARSAIWLPYHRLGLVVVDEEHDPSYKQVDPSPRYNARDAAVVLAASQDARIVLGSATPSMESYFNAVAGKYQLVTLERRHADLEMPEVTVVDMREAIKRKQSSGNFSHILVEQLRETIAAGQQAIIFQNRRGFAPYLECNTCTWTPACVNCDVSLTYHKFKNELRCHYCAYIQGLPQRCAQCGDQDVAMKGFGTERIAEELEVLLPGTKIARLDYDTTRTKNAYSDIIRSFESGEVDVLVGTQMVTKGLDFDRVSLVGILSADSLLHFPEFRAHERAFQLLAQVSGRAGRKKQGQVVVQAYKVNNPVLTFVLNHDFKGFYLAELAERYKFFYPPYCRLIEVRLKHRDDKVIENQSRELTAILKKLFGKRVLGPTTPYVSRVRNYYQRQLLIKIEKTLSVQEVKKTLTTALTLFRNQPANRQLIVQIDVDPLG